MRHKITRIWGYAPVQATGYINGLPFYFRARWDYWTFAVPASPDGDPTKVILRLHPGYSIRRPYGKKKSFSASWMSEAMARKCIHFAVSRYLQQMEAPV